MPRSESAARREEDRLVALASFTRGSGSGFLRGVDHQRLVEAKSCDHRGLELGVTRGPLDVHGRREIAATLSAPLARGDGIVVEGGRAGDGEIGGRVWAIAIDGRDVERADAGSEVALWLGPDRPIDGVTRGRRVFKSNDPERERAARAIAEFGTARARTPGAKSARFSSWRAPRWSARWCDVHLGGHERAAAERDAALTSGLLVQRHGLPRRRAPLTAGAATGVDRPHAPR